ncbi:MAG: hypothetical protein RDV48_30590 [Candidatus Eremiobacteraeota bacterium]|nr:hypothetical protein [Candidatus Eremiobacteraeota bacterium]
MVRKMLVIAVIILTMGSAAWADNGNISIDLSKITSNSDFSQIFTLLQGNKDINGLINTLAGNSGIINGVNSNSALQGILNAVGGPSAIFNSASGSTDSQALMNGVINAIYSTVNSNTPGQVTSIFNNPAVNNGQSVFNVRSESGVPQSSPVQQNPYLKTPHRYMPYNGPFPAGTFTPGQNSTYAPGQNGTYTQGQNVILTPR